MTHIFYEFSSLKPGVPDVETLMEVINSSELTRFVMGQRWSILLRRRSSLTPQSVALKLLFCFR